MRVWLIHPKSAVRNIRTIQVCCIGWNAKVWVRRIALLLLRRSLPSSLSILPPSPEIPRHHRLRLLPKAQLFTFGISLCLEELVFSVIAAFEILPVNHSLPLLHHNEVNRAIVYKHLSHQPFVLEFRLVPGATTKK
ncbi:hypothetical protein NIES2111_60590 (plasmid) [Nostoc sp. NIES-2111]|nr:hypothetical protein NIES2111_60590 [Nostoc sp. NIES-2111]